MNASAILGVIGMLVSAGTWPVTHLIAGTVLSTALGRTIGNDSEFGSRAPHMAVPSPTTYRWCLQPA